MSDTGKDENVSSREKRIAEAVSSLAAEISADIWIGSGWTASRNDALTTALGLIHKAAETIRDEMPASDSSTNLYNKVYDKYIDGVDTPDCIIHWVSSELRFMTDEDLEELAS